MANDNTITLTGNATRDAEMRYTSGGTSIASFGIAVNRRWQNKATQEWEEEVSFFNVTAWAKLADNVGETVTKGMRVIVVGRLQQRTWEDDNGEKRHAVDVIADHIGPDLQYATASVMRNPREGGGGYGGAEPPPGYYDESQAPGPGEEPF